MGSPKIEFRLGGGVESPAFVPDEPLARPLNVGQLDLALSVLLRISVSRNGRGGVGSPSPKLTEKNALVLLAAVPAVVFLFPAIVLDSPV